MYYPKSFSSLKQYLAYRDCYNRLRPGDWVYFPNDDRPHPILAMELDSRHQPIINEYGFKHFIISSPRSGYTWSRAVFNTCSTIAFQSLPATEFANENYFLWLPKHEFLQFRISKVLKNKKQSELVIVDRSFQPIKEKSSNKEIDISKTTLHYNSPWKITVPTIPANIGYINFTINR